MKCKFCKSDDLDFFKTTGRYQCNRCHLSSRHKDTIIVEDEPSFDHVPISDLAIEAILDDEGEPSGFLQRYIPDLTLSNPSMVPNLYVDVERARLLSHLLKKERREEREWGQANLRERGYKIIEERKNRRGKKIYVWDRIEQ